MKWLILLAVAASLVLLTVMSGHRGRDLWLMIAVGAALLACDALLLFGLVK